MRSVYKPTEDDRLAMALDAPGVTPDNADLLNPGPGLRERCERLRLDYKAGKLLGTVGAASAGEFAEILERAGEMLRGE